MESLFWLIIVLVIIGVGLMLINTQLGDKIAPPILQIINVVVIIGCLILALEWFGVLGSGPHLRP